MSRIFIQRRDGRIQRYNISRKNMKKYQYLILKSKVKNITRSRRIYQSPKVKRVPSGISKQERELNVYKAHDILATYKHGKKKNRKREEITTARPIPDKIGQVHVLVHYSGSNHDGYSLLGDCYHNEDKLTKQALNHTGTDIESSRMELPADWHLVDKNFIYYRDLF